MPAAREGDKRESGRALGGLTVALLAVSPVVAGPPVSFTDVTSNSGCDFVHRNGASGDKYAVELLGAGGALLDWDGDADLDLYLVQGAGLPGNEYGGQPPRNVLYENVGWGSLPSPGGAPAFRPPFLAVPDAAGAADASYGMGAAAADYDNDGDPDLYVTNFGANRLYRNDAGRFTDVTDAAGVGDPRWSMSAAWVDVDHDGLLDLYVCNYFRYRLEDHGWYGLRKPGYRTHGSPASFRPEPDALYRNRGDGTFEDVSGPSGILAPGPAFGVGVVAGDYDDDGDTDLYVSNDTQANRLFLNDGGGRFTEDGAVAGVAYDHLGKPQAGAGVDAQDVNRDLSVDIVCTALYLGEGHGFYRDASRELGFAEPSLPYRGFGAGFLDVDNDRDFDLFVANGHTMDNVHLYFDHVRFREPNQLFLNQKGRFVEVGDAAGAIVTRAEPSRAVLFGDLDDDGDTDLVVTNVAASPQILRNDDRGENAWVRVQLRGVEMNRDGHGAEVFVTAGRKTRRYQSRSSFGYLASSDPRLLCGLGAADSCRIEVRWHRGAIDRVESVPARRTVVITEGEGGRLLPEGLAALGWAMDEDDL
jgi:hypothetical protein